MLRALLFAALLVGLASCLRNHGIDHPGDHALLGRRQRSDLFELLQVLGCGPRLAGLHRELTPSAPSVLAPMAMVSAASAEIGARRWPLS